ncbi:MAG: hypothetical protein A2Z19_01865 [Deltaproteobacteria bacterium RBG_16_54_18]|nr:MAG: hypothetical protein A2Z19_01865 [Deltaproteobacteria bacterium RBG_16_54_18]
MMQGTDAFGIEPGQSLEIDLFRPEDALGVTSLFKTVYGDGYPIQKFIQPELLIEENAAGRTISSVARTPKGDIVGHNAIFQSAPYDRIYESGAGLVHPAYRGGKGIFTSLVAHGIEVGRNEFGIEAVFGEAVCNHLFSQKVTINLDAITQAIEVDLMPASAYDKEKSATGRVASLLDFKTLKPKPHTVWLPAAYEENLRFIYSGLDDERRCAVADKDPPPDSVTSIKTQVFDFANVARFVVDEAGADFEESLDTHEKAVREKGIIVIQVWVKLSCSWSGRIVDALNKKGYFLGGILPRWFDEDGMLLQKVIGEPNWDGIQLYSDRAKKILDMMKADWRRIDKKEMKPEIF